MKKTRHQKSCVTVPLIGNDELEYLTLKTIEIKEQNRNYLTTALKITL
jgi:hypothetical protein